MILRQSDLKSWQRCPLAWRFQNIDNLPREQGGSSVFGSIIHDCVLFMEVNQDLEGAILRFKEFWLDPSKCPVPTGKQQLQVDYYERGRSWKAFMEKGPRILRDWWSIIQWDSDLVLAREFTFDVPAGQGHVLHGTIDKITVRYNAKLGRFVILLSDYKTNNKVPTYEYLEEDLQFTAYGYASTRVEFWIQLAKVMGRPERDGVAMHEQYRDLPRYGEWVQLAKPERRDAGVREQRHFNRLIMALDAMAMSVAMRIFVPNISGETCRYCEFRKPCGLPELMEDGSLPLT